MNAKDKPVQQHQESVPGVDLVPREQVRILGAQVAAGPLNGRRLLVRGDVRKQR